MLFFLLGLYKRWLSIYSVKISFQSVNCCWQPCYLTLEQNPNVTNPHFPVPRHCVISGLHCKSKLINLAFCLNSSKIISKSRTGFTSPSTWVTSSPSNAPEQKRKRFLVYTKFKITHTKTDWEHQKHRVPYTYVSYGISHHTPICGIKRHFLDPVEKNPHNQHRN